MPPSTVVTPIGLYPFYCTLYPCTLTRRQLPAQVALSFAFIIYLFSFHFILKCTLNWLQLSKRFSLRFRLEIYIYNRIACKNLLYWSTVGAADRWLLGSLLKHLQRDINQKLNPSVYSQRDINQN